MKNSVSTLTVLESKNQLSSVTGELKRGLKP